MRCLDFFFLFCIVFPCLRALTTIFSQGGRGSHKSGVNKISKQAALSFAKRVLERCRKFEDTGFSCFRDPPLRDALFSASPHDAEAKSADGALAATGSNACAEIRSSQLGARLGGKKTPE